MVALMMVVLLGMAALAVDVGAMYVEKAQLQNGADAAALAIAQDCSGGNCGVVADVGQFAADSNAGDETSGVMSITFPAAGRVRVQTNAREAVTGANHFSLSFARVLGFESTEITAAATASWGAPTGGSTLPWTLSECVFRQSLSAPQLAQLNSTGNFVGDPRGTPRILLRYDQDASSPGYPGCGVHDGYAKGGFGWLDGSDCAATVVAPGTVGADTGNNFPSDCVDELPNLTSQPIMIPLFSSSALTGTRATYTLVGFAAFQVTGYKFAGGNTHTLKDPLAPNCTGNCRGIQGFFTRFVSLDEGLTISPTATNYGASVVGLSN